AGVDEAGGVTDADPRELAVVDERASVGLPGVGQQVEALVEAELGVSFEIRGALGGVSAGAASVTGRAAVRALGGAASSVALVHIADDGGEVAIADAHLAAARVGAKPALGVAEIVERVAAEGADEDLAR